MEYTEKSAIERIEKSEARVAKSEKRIELLSDKPVGITIWGAIDFLCNYCGWTWNRLDVEGGTTE